jgi:hypothetical protein
VFHFTRKIRAGVFSFFFFGIGFRFTFSGHFIFPFKHDDSSLSGNSNILPSDYLVNLAAKVAKLKSENGTDVLCQIKNGREKISAVQLLLPTKLLCQ